MVPNGVRLPTGGQWTGRSAKHPEAIPSSEESKVFVTIHILSKIHFNSGKLAG
jgi:hypothetical protein